MKSKTSSALFVALFVLAGQFSLRAQSQDCYYIQCPTNIYAPCEGVWGAHVWYSVLATNRCNPSAPPTVTYSVPPGSVFPSGTNIVCATIQIPGLPARNCCFAVIVDRCCSTNCIDLVCPRDILVGCQQTAGPPGAFVDLQPPRPVNYCGDHNIPATFSVRCVPEIPAGGGPVFFPPGTNTVVCCLSDSASTYINCCSFNVTVTNCPPQTSECRPQIVCPTDIQVQCEGTGGGIVFFPPPHVINPCNLPVTISSTHKSGTFFPNGKTTVANCITWRDPATGVSMTECCSFDVVVRCCPTNCITRLDCPPNLTIDCPGPNGTPLNYTVTGTNTCEQTRVVCDPPPGTIVFGPTNVCCKLINSAGVSLADCCFKVLVNDTTPPKIECPADISVVSSNCQPVAVPIPGITATDDCDPNPTVTCTPSLTAPFACGTTTVICTATDYSGNENKCSFNVTVICPGIEIICPPDLTIRCAAPTGAVVNFNVIATNRCNNSSVPVSCTPPSGSVFLPGITGVCCQTIDPASQPVRCCFKITVIPDDIPPSITCPGNIVVTSPNCTPVDVLYPHPTATDNCQLDYVKCEPPSGSPFSIGTTTVTCCAFDKAGNSNCCTFTVTVRCPSNDCVRIVCPPNIFVDCAGPNGAIVNYDAYGTNTCTGGRLPVTCNHPSGSFFPPGLTTVCCTNSPSGTTASQWCCFDVVVRPDHEPPVINCPSNIFILCSKPNGTRVEYKPTATDNCDPTPTITCVPPSGTLFFPGCTNVTCVATDDAGNSSTCTFKVCVLREGCYLQNPSFEQLNANLPPPAACGDPVDFAIGWRTLSGTPDLWRPPYSSIVPGNCRGRENPCQGTNYAGLEGGLTSTGNFVTEEMMGTLIAPLNNGQQFRLRACLSLAESSPGPVLLEFVLANSADLTQQAVIHQVWVTQREGWMQYQPPCFRVPREGHWDRLIIRMAKSPAGTPPYRMGYAYIDNVNICCCKPVLQPPTIGPNGVTVTWSGRGQLQGAKALSDSIDWQDINTPVEYDPEADTFTTHIPLGSENLFFRVVGPDGGTIDCAECGG